MAKGPKTLNPVDKARKEARKRELKKNKKQRQLVRSQRESEAIKAAQAVRVEDVILPPLPDAADEKPKRTGDRQQQPRPVELGPKPGVSGKSNSIIESKPVIFFPKVTKFVPASVRSKLGSSSSSGIAKK
uniref:WW domain-binding protein 11 n=1 Tax=Aceria tosichella TaxID=561515 RepID=A0A6G1S9A1_9ACAR